MNRLAPCALVAILGLAPGLATAQSFAPLPGFERVRGARAVAVDAASGRTAVGTSSSVWLASPGAVATRALRPGEVRDLAFGSDGALWVASTRGVYQLSGGQLREHALGTGASGRATRILLADGAVWVGSEDGLWLRGPGAPGFARVDGAAPEGAVLALASAGAGGVVAAFGSDIARIEPGPAPQPFRIAREALPPGDGLVLDLAALADGRVLALRERGLAQRAPGRAVWERVAISLPPGALPVRIAAAGGAIWIASDAGALEARAPAGPYARAPAPAGGAVITALAASGDAILLAGPRGVLRGRLRRAAPEGAAEPLPAPADPREPRVLSVQRAALRYLALHPRDFASLRERPRQSAYAPTLELFGGYAGDDDEDRDWDETFTSGVDRTFLDRGRAHGRSFDAGVALRWELGGAVYHPEEIDAAREAREWIELRDEVLDELAQLYFERRRALLELGVERDPLAAARLRLRADELAAGLDAWTGGWWSAELERLSPRGPAQESLP